LEATLTRRRLLSLLIAGASLLLATAPVPGLRRPLVVVVGSELAGAMAELEPIFERRHGGIDLAWKVQGAQDMVNRAREEGPERPRVLIPANRDLLDQLADGHEVSLAPLDGRASRRTDDVAQGVHTRPQCRQQLLALLLVSGEHCQG